ncbi:MAG TPA: hypothetical protein VGQ39_11845 [Pyrinomonadaceae bacterium]|jgi:hypothetical protein|nr:hypothetical protein [Pyrinomonadaceae bacterium]
MYRSKKRVVAGVASGLALTLTALLFCSPVVAQRKKAKKPEPPRVTELSRLRDEYIKATNEYKASLQKLLDIYEDNVKREEEKLATLKKLYDEGLVSKTQVEDKVRALGGERDKVAESRRQMAAADSQIADVLVEAEADAQLAKNLRLARNRLVRTSSFMRYTGMSGWGLSDAWKIQRFFTDTFNKALPIAVFGQGVIHDRWRLDHRNAMDISLHPDGPEGQALLNFLQKNGIPFSAFRSAIPGTATGPHIHIGRPSHRY